MEDHETLSLLSTSKEYIMEYIENDKVYRMASNLNAFQKKLYMHLIDWKFENLRIFEPGHHGENVYDYMFPDEYIKKHPLPPFIYDGLHKAIEDMQKGKFAYKVHKMAYHMASSQTACVNLFMPILLDDQADIIVRNIPGCPKDFLRIDRDRLYKGFCFEYWGQDFACSKGVLGDHSNAAGTDSDLAIAYINDKGEHCLWLIEHKLTEKEFTTCGGYKSDGNKDKEACRTNGLSDLISFPNRCHYHRIGYDYWNITAQNQNAFKIDSEFHRCPFCGGMNQLWRNQLLAFAYMNCGQYAHVSFSVVHHRDNDSLETTLMEYRNLITSEITMTSFTNEDVVSVVEKISSGLSEWAIWYRNLYYI